MHFLKIEIQHLFVHKKIEKMKNYFGLFLLFCLSLSVFTSCSKEVEEDDEMEYAADSLMMTNAVLNVDYPALIDDYLADNFPNLSVDEVEKLTDGNFEVELSDGTTLIFDAMGQFIEEEEYEEDEDEDDEEDDEEVVTEYPDAIDNYLNEFYPDAIISEVELNADGTYEVELEDGTELTFDEDGNFIE